MNAKQTFSPILCRIVKSSAFYKRLTRLESFQWQLLNVACFLFLLYVDITLSDAIAKKKKKKKKKEYFANEKQNKKCSSYEKTWRHYGKIVLRIVWADAQWQIKLDNTQLDPVLRLTSKSWTNLCDVWKTARSSAGKSIPTSWPGGNGAEKGKEKNKLWACHKLKRLDKGWRVPQYLKNCFL